MDPKDELGIRWKEYVFPVSGSLAGFFGGTETTLAGSVGYGLGTGLVAAGVSYAAVRIVEWELGPRWPDARLESRVVWGHRSDRGYPRLTPVAVPGKRRIRVCIRSPVDSRPDLAGVRDGIGTVTDTVSD